MLFKVCPDGIASDFRTNVHWGSVVELCDERGRQSTHIAEEVIQLSRSCAIVCLETITLLALLPEINVANVAISAMTLYATNLVFP